MCTTFFTETSPDTLPDTLDPKSNGPMPCTTKNVAVRRKKRLGIEDTVLKLSSSSGVIENLGKSKRHVSMQSVKQTPLFQGSLSPGLAEK